VKAVAAGFGVAFGFLLSWGQMTNPDVIRDMLLLSDPYLFLMMGASVAVGFAGVRIVRRVVRRSVVTHEPIAWAAVPVERRHVTGSVVFGLGWALSASCPGPITAQLGQGQPWALCTAAGAVIGLLAFERFSVRGRRHRGGDRRAQVGDQIRGRLDPA
jgi:uncharacterized protein